MEEQTKPQMIVLVSPNGSQIMLADAIKPDYLNWRVTLVPVPEQPQNGNGAQPEPMPEIEPANVD